MQKDDELVRRAAEWYEDKTAFRAALCAIPYIGGSLDVIFMSYAHRWREDRFNDMVSELSARMDDLDPAQLDPDSAEAEAYYDLFVKCAEAAMRERRSEKRALFAGLLANAAHMDPDSLDTAALVTDSLDRLSIFDFSVLVWACQIEHDDFWNGRPLLVEPRPQEDASDNFNTVPILSVTFGQVPVWQLHVSCNNLEREAALKDEGVTRYDISRGELYVVTEYGQMIVDRVATD
ncbi:MAG: hypothetical protein ACLFWB_09070 [Armatimonadota bacterium]